MREIGTLHSAFYCGTVLTVFLSHHLAQKFGAKKLISFGIVANILCTWSIPLIVAITKHYIFTAIIRLIMGLGQGMYIPCASLLVAKWFANNEKSTAMAIFTTGSQVGISLAMYATAGLCKAPILSGWPTSFALYGKVGRKGKLKV